MESIFCRQIYNAVKCQHIDIDRHSDLVDLSQTMLLMLYVFILKLQFHYVHLLESTHCDNHPHGLLIKQL
mgnify:CR=1 FL=1